ncbi:MULTISPECIES: DUF3142 domain-containing protein [Pseudomonas]|uniref:DUF3142 domain-containing protein n=1 Tax=Pseudomonas TaxID=286 RepID=UPI001147A11A|nr:MULTISPECIES: DUF3142 domain-containing protein [Pseudomonas fluorescens group]KAA8551016.1 hypothetical protein FX984_06324 [Pseudomonas marginalis]MCP1466535.1 hypothetical protein [Pseudomonas sp. S3E17]QDH62566.1 DUF3142 domain-containing protein [Pseudomonas azotoformans]TWR63389.1 DUF3142 domain-containing protein [Pseudomonas marginalis]
MKHLWLGVLLLASPAFGAVDARDYDAFWLWSGVTPQPVLKQAKTLYILQGQINATRRAPQRGVQLIAQGISVPRLTRGDVWVVYRAHTLRWPEQVYTQLLGQVQRWRDAGNPVVGIQIDFDARTQYLHEYADFLRDLRQRLPADLKLSITGLMDWSSNADPTAISQLKGVVDEVVVQTYQGRQSIPDYAAYLPRMNRMGLPFKIGLIQGGEWEEPGYLQGSEWFRGYVVFLRNP